MYTNAQTFDGGGQVVKYTRSQIFDGTPGTDQITYYLRSTVLGGKAISEYGNQGAWIKTYVYTGAERTGVLGVYYGYQNSNQPFNQYRFADPITGDEVVTMKNPYTTGGLDRWTTLDTNGVDMPLNDPFPPGGEGSNDCEIWDDSGGGDSGGGKEAHLMPIETQVQLASLTGLKCAVHFQARQSCNLLPTIAPVEPATRGQLVVQPQNIPFSFGDSFGASIATSHSSAI